MALSAKQRKRIPSSKFVYPNTRKYPIDTPKRARAALRLAGKKNTSGSYAKVAKAVRSRYGGRIKSVAKKGKRR